MLEALSTRGTNLASLFVAVGILAPFPGGPLGEDLFPAATETIDAPLWESGEWWRLRVNLDNKTTKNTVTVDLGLVRDPSGTHHFGLHEWDHRILFAAMVPMGKIGPTAFTFDVHGRPFTALEFPLEDGKTWNTQFGIDPAVARVVKIQDGQAHIQYTLLGEATALRRGSAPFSAVWDDKIGFFQRITHPDGIEVVTLGHGMDGPRVLYTARSTPDLTPRIFSAPLAGNGVGGVFDVPPGYQHLALLLGFSTTNPDPNVVYNVSFTPSHSLSKLPNWFGKRAPTYSVGRNQAKPDGERFGTFLHRFTDAQGDDEEWDFTAHGDARTTFQAQAIAFTAPTPIHEDPEPRPIPVASSAMSRQAAVPEDNVWTWRMLAAGLALGYPLLRPGGILWALLAKISGRRVLEHPTRRRLLEAVRRDPGISTQELRHLLELPWTTAVHHLKILETTGVLVRSRSGRQGHWFDVEHGGLSRDRLAIASLRSPATRRVYECILENPGSSLVGLAKMLGVQHTTVGFHLRRLQQMSIVEGRAFGQRRRYFVVPPVYSSVHDARRLAEQN